MTEKSTEIATREHSAISQFSQSDIEIIKNSVAKNTTDNELKYFLAVAATNGLNPFNKEIWCYKAGSDLLIFAGRDGFLANAQRQPDFNGIRSSAVYSNDKFLMDIPAGHVTHSFGVTDRGELLGAYAFAYRKNFQPFLVWVDIKTYDKGVNAWKTHRASMIEKTAEAHVLKRAYPLGAVNVESDYDFQRNTFDAPQTEDGHYTEIPPPSEITVDEAILNAIDDAKTIEEVTAIYNDNSALHGQDVFIKALGKRKQQIKKEAKDAS